KQCAESSSNPCAKCGERGLNHATAFRILLPGPVQLAALGSPWRPDGALPHLCGALVGALARRLLPGGALPAGHGAHRLLVLQILQTGSAKPRAFPPRR